MKRHRRATLLRGSALALPVLLAVTMASPASAQDATWDGSGLPGRFDDSDNWTPGAVPTGTATFTGATPTLTLPVFGFAVFTNTSTAGAGTITVGINSTVQFLSSASAGTANITVETGGQLQFATLSTAANATITVGDSALLTFQGAATA